MAGNERLFNRGKIIITMKKLSVSLSGHQTSISLEPEFIDALHKIAMREKKSVASIIEQIDAARHAGENLSSAIRVWIFKKCCIC